MPCLQPWQSWSDSWGSVMVSRSDAAEAYSWAAGSAVDLLTRPETRRALFAVLDTLPNDHTSTRQEPTP